MVALKICNLEEEDGLINASLEKDSLIFKLDLIIFGFQYEIPYVLCQNWDVPFLFSGLLAGDSKYYSKLTPETHFAP